MPVTGRKPKPDGQKRNRVKPTFEWREVENVPFEGPIPVDLPEDLSAGTQRWWAAISKMPHCILWEQADWVFALESALVRELFEADPLKANRDLMAREKLLGMTFDHRRDLRIRYIEPETKPELAEVTSLDDYVGLAGSHKSAGAAS